MAENFGKIDVQKNNVRNSYFYDNKIQYFKNQNYLTIKSECLKKENNQIELKKLEKKVCFL